MPRLFLFILVVLGGLGCDSSTTGTTPPPTPAGDEIVEGVNLTELFDDPTGAERSAVRSEWASRDATLSSRYTFTLEASLTGSDGAELNVYAGRDAGSGDVLFYGLVRLPIRLPGDVALRPTVLVLPDGDGGASGQLLTDGSLPIGSSIREDYVYAMLVYRGETLLVGDEAFTSTSQSSAYDFDADDALAFVDHVRGAELLADPNRVGVIGVGRGGGVALLTASRNNLYNVVIDLAGPANFFSESFRSEARSVLTRGVAGDFPALQSLADQIVLPLRDSVITTDEARLALLRRSPSHFVAPPPFLFVAHGNLDSTVPIDHSRSIGSIFGTEAALYLEVFEADHQSLAANHDVISLTTSFLTEHLGDP